MLAFVGRGEDYTTKPTFAVGTGIENVQRPRETCPS